MSIVRLPSPPSNKPKLGALKKFTEDQRQKHFAEQGGNEQNVIDKDFESQSRTNSDHSKFTGLSDNGNYEMLQR